MSDWELHMEKSALGMTAEQIGRAARSALVREAELSPKPGLVDAENCGAHHDMDLQLLIKSAKALEPYFTRFAAQGMRDTALPPDGRISAIRADGMEAESAMFAATNGVNTHKGALFLLGVLCYSAGHCAANEISLLPETICQTAARVCSGITRELGENCGRAYLRYGARGARGEAEDGFPHVLEAMRVYSVARGRGATQEEGWLVSLLTLISSVEDANVLARCGDGIAKELRRRAGDIAARYSAGGAGFVFEIQELDRDCRRWSASPGGTADLLACGMFFSGLIAEKHR